ncbi:MAG TPA: hypothetical protein VNA20_05175 [Frankiaceae bacterium]|nr:hypothetical protein [Frankiaceae bacterium]
MLTATLACSASDSARTPSARQGDAAGPGAHGPAASPPPSPARTSATKPAPGPSAAPAAPRASGPVAAGARPVLAALRDPAAFDATYAVRGDLVVRHLGADHLVTPPAVVTSTWDDLIAAIWVRGDTGYGPVGFSLGYTDRDFRQLNALSLYLPSAPGAERPADGYVDLSLAHGLPWLGARVGELLSAPTKDGRWDVVARWTDPRTLRISVLPRPGAATPGYFRSGLVTVSMNGPARAPWRVLGLRLAVLTGAGRVSGELTARAR